MEDLYRNKYQVSSARLSSWHYGLHGLYFVTICTTDRVPYFGEIEDQGLSKTQGIASLRETEIGKIQVRIGKTYPHFIRMLNWTILL